MRWAPVLEDVQIGLGVEGAALLEQLGQAGGRIGAGQQGPRRGIGPKALQQELAWGIEPDHDPLVQLAPVFWAGHHATAGGHHQGMPGGDLVQNRRFQGPEPRLALAGEQLGDRLAGHLFHAGVGIEEAVAQGLGQGPAHGAFAAAHHADQIEVHPLQAPAQLQGRIGSGAGTWAGGGRSHRQGTPS